MDAMIRPACAGPAAAAPRAGGAGGFTLIELTAVIVIAGVLAVLLLTRLSPLGGPELARLSEVRAQIRYVQLRAMKTGSVLGVTCDTANYWAFQFNSTNPTNTDARLPLPGETGAQVSLTGKNTAMNAFTYYFDGFGIPYTAYTSASINTKLAVPAAITISAGGNSATLTLTPETGHVQ